MQTRQGLRITDSNRGAVDVPSTSTAPRFFYGVIRILLIVRIYRVQILKCALPYFRVQNLQMYGLQILQNFRSGIADIQMVDYRCTEGGAVKCEVMDALLAKLTARLYFTDYRWRCREV